MAALLRTLREIFSKAQPVLEGDLSEKTVVVIGANTGLGFEACKHFASMNPGKLIMGCRSQAKGDAALAKLKEQMRYEKAELWIVDLASLTSVKSFVDRFEKECERLDILVENAGMSPPLQYERTEDGFATILQVNAIAPALHALLLLPHMLKTAKTHSTTPRIVNVSSDAHLFASLPHDKKLITSPNLMEEMSTEDYYKRM
ncbi:short-chain dehydrogenase [Moniliophthora roreri MCA 2997]|uniref:Short-chain dehydrogenase n=1 Tax=Moniliophthora roreri (strain MCA 2997) TaxID=1381753 RepID=V2XJK4_MONRO|nr:short-chain dehydrogenase [Moniliophthora roreri MCA 2997]